MHLEHILRMQIKILLNLNCNEYVSHLLTMRTIYAKLVSPVIFVRVYGSFLLDSIKDVNENPYSFLRKIKITTSL